MLITLVSCSYKPIFSERNYNFEINEIKFIGEEDVNKIIKRNLRLIKKNNNSDVKIYNLLITTNKKKKTISKNTKGDPLKFELIITTIYQISDQSKKLKDNKIVKKNIYNNNSDKFQLEKNEKIIIENLSERISEIMISSIIDLNDN